MRAVSAVMEGMDRADVNFVPVYRVGAGPVGRVVRPWAERASGVALRVRALEPLAQGTRTLASVLLADAQMLGAAPGATDARSHAENIDPQLVLPFEDVHAIVREVTATAPWRSVALIGTCVPQSLSSVGEGTLGEPAAHPSGTVAPTARGPWRPVRRLRDPGPAVPVLGPRRTHAREPAIHDRGRDRRGSGRGRRQRTPAPGARRRSTASCAARSCSVPSLAVKTAAGAMASSQTARSGCTPAGNQNLWRGAGTSHHLKEASTVYLQRPSAARRRRRTGDRDCRHPPLAGLCPRDTNDHRARPSHRCGDES